LAVHAYRAAEGTVRPQSQSFPESARRRRAVLRKRVNATESAACGAGGTRSAEGQDDHGIGAGVLEAWWVGEAACRGAWSAVLCVHALRQGPVTAPWRVWDGGYIYIDASVDRDGRRAGGAVRSERASGAWPDARAACVAAWDRRWDCHFGRGVAWVRGWRCVPERCSVRRGSVAVSPESLGARCGPRCKCYVVV
jgi:hypothetical protein